MGHTWPRWAACVLAAICAVIQPPPALGQEQAAYPAEVSIPRQYPSRASERAPPDKPAETLSREASAADAAAAACAAGNQAGCSDLGWAHHKGEGRPQNRPVAELIYRKACAAGEASACYRLASLIGTIDSSDPDQRHADQTEAANLMVQACRMGSPEGCDAEADDLQSGVVWQPDPATSEALRRQACTDGHAPACRKLADLLLGEDRGAAGRREAEALLDRQCRAGDSEACLAAERHWRVIGRYDSARVQAYQALACEAGEGRSCAEMGLAAISRDPPDRAAALALFDRACAADGLAGCGDAAALREQPGLALACEAGERPACIGLANLMAVRRGLFEDRAGALALLGPACEAEPGAHCHTAASLLFQAWLDNGESGGEAERVQAYLESACASGVRDACRDLATALANGRLLPRDEARAAELYVPFCDEGDQSACRFIVWFAEQDNAAAPMLLAAGVAPLGRTPEEIAAEQEAEREERARADAARRAERCTDTAVEYEGVIYNDTLCDTFLRAIGGFSLAGIEQAPWQAMIWRPAQIGRRQFPERQRVACGGSVVATGWILTAAHCLVDTLGPNEAYPIDKHPYRIRLGVLRPLQMDEGLSYPILRVISHPLYTRRHLRFDIALVQYDPRAGTRGASPFRPARIALDTRTLEQRPVVPRTPVFAYGWGRTELGRAAAAEVLQGVKLELHDQARCNELTGFVDQVAKDAALCAMGPKREQACYGDSGGPLVTFGDRRGVPVLIGVVSGGRDCGTTGIASQYTRIGHPRVREWLASHLPGFRGGLTGP